MPMWKDEVPESVWVLWLLGADHSGHAEGADGGFGQDEGTGDSETRTSEGKGGKVTRLQVEVVSDQLKGFERDWNFDAPPLDFLEGLWCGVNLMKEVPDMKITIDIKKVVDKRK